FAFAAFFIAAFTASIWSFCVSFLRRNEQLNLGLSSPSPLPNFVALNRLANESRTPFKLISTLPPPSSFLSAIGLLLLDQIFCVQVVKSLGQRLDGWP